MTAPSSRMLTEAEANDLVDRLHRVSARWRPFVIIGLVGIILGFVVLAWTLNARLKKANALAAEQATSIIALNGTLASLKFVVARNLADTPGESDWHAMARLLDIADEQNETLGATIDVPPHDPNPAAIDAVRSGGPADNLQKITATVKPTPVDDSPKIVRLFIQIASDEQRPAAEAMAALWSGRQIGGATIVVPGIELVRNGDNTVRCTRADTCKSLDTVTRWINATLAKPKLNGKDISKRYANASGILPGTYEIWFAAEPIEPALATDLTIR